MNDNSVSPKNINPEFDAEITEDVIKAMELTDPEMLALLNEIDPSRPVMADKVVVPALLDEDTRYVGPIFGYIREESGYHAIMGWEGHMTSDAIEARQIGVICEGNEDGQAWATQALKDGTQSVIIGTHGENGELSFRWVRRDEEGGIITLEKDIYLLRQDAFSRNSGLLETDWMAQKCVVLSGVGSVGSLAALQLARAGVGRFVLVDTDCMEIHNVCRHQCSLKDVGRYKVDAVAERILQINPYAEIRKYYQRIQNVPYEAYRDWVEKGKALFIGACDNRVGNAFACDAAKELGVPFIALGFRDRAWAGELFVYLPQRGDVCYRCAFNKQIEESIEEERRNHLYLNDSARDTMKIVPGLDVDIEYGTALLDKVALDVLNIGNRDYRYRLLPKIDQFNFFAACIDRSEDPFWEKLLPAPISFRPVRLDENTRRCKQCLESKRP